MRNPPSENNLVLLQPNKNQRVQKIAHRVLSDFYGKYTYSKNISIGQWAMNFRDWSQSTDGLSNIETIKRELFQILPERYNETDYKLEHEVHIPHLSKHPTKLNLDTEDSKYIGRTLSNLSFRFLSQILEQLSINLKKEPIHEENTNNQISHLLEHASNLTHQSSEIFSEIYSSNQKLKVTPKSIFDYLDIDLIKP